MTTILVTPRLLADVLDEILDAGDGAGPGCTVVVGSDEAPALAVLHDDGTAVPVATVAELVAAVRGHAPLAHTG